MLQPCDVPLRTFLRDQPRSRKYEYTEEAQQELLEALFKSMAAGKDEYMRVLFPSENKNGWSLSKTQGGVEGAEYTEGARGKACGHIFRPGEASYRCKECATDPMCTLCSRCFEASDHEGHLVAVSVNQGTPGSCDCGDPEAWKCPLKCAIHSELEGEDGMDIDRESKLPLDFQQAIRQTIAVALDYVLDIISCSPEHFRIPKSRELIVRDEEMSRLTSRYYRDSEDDADPEMEYSVLIWNDEKHTITAVRDQVARACKKTKQYGWDRGEETDRVGRSLVEKGYDLDKLLGISKIIEQIKLTVTIRSSRDTFREEMCATIIEWLLDISSCAVGPDNHILRRTVCEELLEPWTPGSKAGNVEIGRYGIDDHSLGEGLGHNFFSNDIIMDDDSDDDEEDDEAIPAAPNVINIEIPPELRAPVPEAQPPGTNTQTRTGGAEPAVVQHHDDLELPMVQAPPPIPETPAKNKPKRQRKTSPPSYWLTRPSDAKSQQGLPPYEDLRQRVRLDWLILFDLRFWKKTRTNVRDLFIGTVIAIPQFKRIIGLRFAGLYTILSQLFLIADREPDRSIIHMSFQMLSAPSTVVEVVKKANFITILMAIIYTFLTARQVGYPSDVDPDAPLSIETGTFTSRRLFNIFHSIRILCEADYVKECVRTDGHYLLQFLDIARLHHGLCPNTRAKDKHIEYEPESWISAGLIMREISRLGMQMAQSFQLPNGKYSENVERAITQASNAAISISLGYTKYGAVEEPDKPVDFTKVIYEWERYGAFRVIKYYVDSEPMSFHHPLHYTLSWMIEIGRGMPAGALLELMRRGLMDYDLDDSDSDQADRSDKPDFDPRVLAFFDYPLRVCVWLAQMKAGLWVRNGFSLRHQMQTYRGVFDRDFGLNRDVFLLQTALVTLNPSLVLANMVERYSLSNWVTGVYTPPESWEPVQLLEVAEEFLHTLIVLLCERNALIPSEEEPNLEALKIQREVAHVLCFKPIPFSELTTKLPDKITDSERFMEVLEGMTNFKDPEGISDSGSFELKDSFKNAADPYFIHFTRNQREDTETSYRNRVSKATGKPPQDVVFTPEIYKIKTGLFSKLSDFVRTGIFAQIIFYSLRYSVYAEETEKIPATRVESFLLMALHLCQIGVQVDATAEEKDANLVSSLFVDFFIQHANVVVPGKENEPTSTIAGVLNYLSNSKTYPGCAPKARHILNLVKEKNPRAYANISQYLDIPTKREDTREATEAEKKRLAEERRAKIMASFAQQQQNFMSTAGFNFDDIDMDEDEDYEFVEPEKKTWAYPAGTCIVCQEEMDEKKLYGNLVMVSKSNIFRTTPMDDSDFLGEVCATPANLDRSADHLRPFGVASANKIKKTSLATDGSQKVSYVTGLGKGFPPEKNAQGPVAVSCNHSMHFQCFEQYYDATKKRHHQQNSRKHPERLEKSEFVCPLCKALGNAFFPIIWKPKSEGSIEPALQFDTWLEQTIPALFAWKSQLEDGPEQEAFLKIVELGTNRMVQPLAAKVQNLEEVMSKIAASSNNALDEALGLPCQRFIQVGGVQVGGLQVGGVQVGGVQVGGVQVGGVPVGGVPVAGNIQARIAPNPTVPDPAVLPGVVYLPAYENKPINPEYAKMQEIELYRIYLQLRDSFVANGMGEMPAVNDSNAPMELVCVDTLAQLLGHTIESVEITQRGVATDTEASLLDSIPEQVVNLLRILSETVNSYIAVGYLRNMKDKNAARIQYNEQVDKQVVQIFGVSYFCTGVKPLFANDTFQVLAEASVFLGPGCNIDIHHLLRLLYTAEILKFAFNYACTDLPGDETLNKNYVWPGSEFRLLSELLGHMDEYNGEYTLKKKNYYPAFFGTLLEKYALIFLRKALILLHVRHGFQPQAEANPNDSELVRLSRHLGLPSISTIIEQFVDESPANEHGRNLRNLFGHWVFHFYNPDGPGTEAVDTVIRMPHPAIYELIGLPDNYGVLMDEAVRRKCPTTGKDMVEPALCFFCGDIVCSQAICCEKEKKGGCTQHMLKCGKNVGVFLNIRKCSLIYLHGDKDSVNGTFTAAPYLDRYGEIDQGLKRTRPLFLNRKRYDALLRKVWLSHGIPAIISRKLEAETNNGGWETL